MTLLYSSRILVPFQMMSRSVEQPPWTSSAPALLPLLYSPPPQVPFAALPVASTAHAAPARSHQNGLTVVESPRAVDERSISVLTSPAEHQTAALDITEVQQPSQGSSDTRHRRNADSTGPDAQLPLQVAGVRVGKPLRKPRRTVRILDSAARVATRRQPNLSASNAGTHRSDEPAVAAGMTFPLENALNHGSAAARTDSNSLFGHDEVYSRSSARVTMAHQGSSMPVAPTTRSRSPDFRVIFPPRAQAGSST